MNCLTNEKCEDESYICNLKSRTLIEVVMKTKDDFDETDIKFVKDLISDTIDKNNNKNNSKNKNNKIKINNGQLIKFILSIYLLSYTGKFCLTQNYNFYNAVKNRDKFRILKLITGSDKDRFPELHNNPKLDQNEFDQIKNIEIDECKTLLNVYNEANSEEDFYNMIPCKTLDKNTDLTLNTEGNITYSQIKDECRDKICIFDQKSQLNLNWLIPANVYLIDYREKQAEKYCFELLDLIQRLSEKNYKNPNTNNNFSDSVIESLLNKYQKEIKMYDRFLELTNLF